MKAIPASLRRPAAPRRGDPRRGALLLRAVAVLGAALGGFLAGSGVFRSADHERAIAALEEQIDELQLRLELLRERTRVAHIDQVDQGPSEQRPGGVRTRFRFREVDAEGRTLGTPQRFEVEGDLAYFDARIIKFDDAFVEQRDLLRGSSILLFQRVFGEYQAPAEGFPIDAVGARPAAYAAGAEGPAAFHEELWRDFWRYANEPEVARRSGVRAMHGEAPSIRLAKGRSYELELRTSGGLSIRVADSAEDGAAER